MASVSITTWCLIGVVGIAVTLIGWTLMGEASRTVDAVVADVQDEIPPPPHVGHHREDGATQRIVPPPPMYPRA